MLLIFLIYLIRQSSLLSFQTEFELVFIETDITELA